MTAHDVIATIASGEMDDRLDAVISAVRARRRYLADVKVAQNQAALIPGTHVEICGTISPQYLIGVTGKVSDERPRRRGDLMVELDPGQYTGRFSSRSLAVPANCLRAA